MAEPITWTTTDASGAIRHRPATQEVLMLFKQSYLGELNMPLPCPLQEIQDRTDPMGIPWLSVMAGITALVMADILEQVKYTSDEAVEVLSDKRGQLLSLIGVKHCAWCRGQTAVLIALQYKENSGAMVCGCCAAEYEYLTTQQFYQLTEYAYQTFWVRGMKGGSDAKTS